VTSNSLADTILAKLGLVVFERLPDGVFMRIAPARAPEWFSRLYLGASGSAPVTLQEAFPFLEGFLLEADEIWRGAATERLRSEPFTILDRAGVETLLVASALAVEHRSFLILEQPDDFDERRRTLQRAREHTLAHEDHVRRTGALLEPIEAARQLLHRLEATGLGPDQQTLTAAIGERLASVTSSLETLAPLPKGVPRRRR
jgi:hypothetical protein